MRKFDEKEFNEDWNVFWGNCVKCGIDNNTNKDELYNNLKTASNALTEDTGSAYPGALLHHIVLSTSIAQRLSKMVSGTFSISEESLLKVALLIHLSKIEMYVPNTAQYEIDKYGRNYVFANLNGKLKFGERSILNACNNGIKFTPEEFEAMRCIDKKGEDTKGDYFDSILSTIIRQANELAYAIEREKNKK